MADAFKLILSVAILVLIQLRRVSVNAQVNIQPRHTWTKSPLKGVPRLFGQAQYVIVHHTVTAQCSHSKQCQQQIRNVQEGHKRRRFRDIGYNFLIGGDGLAYEGLGFGWQGEHAKKFNHNSIGIAFIGNYDISQPTPRMIQTARALIEFAMRTGRLRPNYILAGHRQTKSTACPGRNLFAEIQKWPRWSARI